MSMHEFEALVEDSVEILATSGRPGPELRSLYWNLYEFEAHWDTGFTHFRSMDRLLEARFVYRYAIPEHPDYAARRSYFDSLAGFSFVEPEDGGYVQPPALYFDAGSPLWQRFVELGRLTGSDAERPRRLPLTSIAYDVARLAEAAGNRRLVSWWYRLLAPELLGDTQIGELEADPVLRDLRALVRRTGALAVKDDYGLLRDPDPRDLAETPGLAWWFDLSTVA